MSLIKKHRRDLPASDYSREKSRNALLFTLAVAVFAVIAGFMFRAQPEAGQVLRHNLAPDFPRGYTWVNCDGHISLFQELKGHVVVVLFNSLSVLADLRDVNRMEELSLLFDDSPVACVIVAAGMGSAQEVEQWPMQCPILLDPDSTVTRLFGVNALPAVLIIDSYGAVAARYYESWEQIPLEDLIRDLLAQAYANRTIAPERYTP